MTIDQFEKWREVIRNKPGLIGEITQLIDYESGLELLNSAWADEFISKKCWSPNDTPVVAANTVTLLHRRGLLERHGSNKSKYYSILDMEGARAALEAATDPGSDDEPTERVEYVKPEIPADLFGGIKGYDDVKEVFGWSIEADDPIHIALKGRPATAKTVFLEEVARCLPRAIPAEGYDSSKAAIRDQLLDERPYFYLIDEFGEMHPKHLAIMRGLCGTGRVTVTLSTRKQSVYLPTRVYVACNRWPADPDGAIRSRFEIFELDEYQPGEFDDIAVWTLVNRESVEQDVAEYIVKKLKGLTLDIRKVVAVARISKGAEDPLARVDRYLEIKKARGGVF